MTVDKNYTPLPFQRVAPVTVEVADWFDLPGNDNHRVLREKGVEGQALNIHKIGGRPEADVDINLRARVDTSQGQVDDEETVESSALHTYGNVTEAGPVATRSIIWEVNNRSSTDHTQANGASDPYQAFLNYTLRSFPVIEKIRRGMALSNREESLAEQFNLFKKERLGVPDRVDPTLEPNLDGKVVADEETITTTVDVTETGESSSVNIVTEAGLPGRGLVAYVTGLRINSQNYAFGDNLTVSFVRNGTNEFYRLETKGLPGFSNEYKADLHIPFLTRMDVEVFADTVINDVDVQVEYALVQRSLLEKALYDLENEVIQGDEFDQNRREVFDKLRNRVVAGIGVEDVLEGIQFAQEARA